MKGNNRMSLNKATVAEAIQYWLDSKTISTIGTVTDVGYNASTYMFEVYLSGSEKEDA